MINGLTSWEKEAYEGLFPKACHELDGEIIHVRRVGPGKKIHVEQKHDCWEVTLEEGASFGRSLMLLKEAILTGRSKVTEKPAYGMLGMLLDCSRGAVLKVSMVKKLLQMLAFMGYGSLQLYMEDTCALSPYPYWGYRRGAYTADEMKEMDRYAAMVGIELVPAVQTLAHMGQALKWPAFTNIMDTDGIFLIGEEETYRLIDVLFGQLAENFTSRRVNIGMDEAHMVGLGEYLRRHGYEDRLKVMLQHFERVHQLARRHGLQPMMWSDMFFRLAAGGEYYEPDAIIDGRVADLIPDDVSLIYWDYYSEEKDIYDRMIEKHKRIKSNMIFAGGAWKWRGFSPGNQFSMKLADIAHRSCVEHGVEEILITAWGDNGAECALFSILPSLQYWAELCYGNSDESAIQRRFSICCRGEWGHFIRLDEPVFTPHNPSPGRCEVNAPKYLFYQDVLGGLFDAHVDPDSYEHHFEVCEKRLREAAAESSDEWRYLFEFQSEFCHVLSIKCRVGLDLRNAYKQDDREMMGSIGRSTLPKLYAALETCSKVSYRQWMNENKAAGYDVIDLRMGGLLKRIATAQQRIEAYLRGELKSLEELEEPLLSYDGIDTGQVRDIAGPFWHRIVSGSNIASI